MSKKKKIPQEMQSTINFHVKAMTWVGGVGGLAGAGADIPLVATSWVTMTIALAEEAGHTLCLLYTSPSPRDLSTSRMPSSA